MQGPAGPSAGTNPSLMFRVVTPNDTVNVHGSEFRALYVGVSGNVHVVPEFGDPCVFQNVPAGTILPVQGIRVNATGTTATNIVALF